MVNEIIDGKYEIISKIGTGGTSIVYKARRLADDKIVAIKVIRDELDNINEHERRFRLEAAALAKMSHRNVRRILAVGQWDSSLYMVTEYIDGETLKDIIAEEGALNVKKAVDYALQIVAGIEHAHRRDIIHRDIKPQNIIVAKDGTVKIVDFGIARMTSQTTRTMAGKDVVGSVHYLSPEQARGTQIDARSDIYSFGILLYQMFTGRVPFDGSEPVSIAMKHINQTPEPPISVNPSIPKGINDIILKCIQKRPDARYQTASLLREDLLLFVANPNGFNVELERASKNEPKMMQEDEEQPIRRRRPTNEEAVARRERERQVKTKVSYINDDERKMAQAEKGKRGLGLLIALIASALAVIIGAVVIVSSVLGDTNYPEKPIPTISGLTKAAAKAVLESEAFSKFRFVEEDSSEVAVGCVIRTEPEEKSVVKVNREIVVYICKGAKQLMPQDVIGKKEAEAAAILQGQGFKVEFIYTENKDYENGIVVQQSNSSQAMNQGATITLTVIKNIELLKIVVPDLSGMTDIGEIKKKITDAGCQVGKYQEKKTDDLNTLGVSWQNIEAGKEYIYPSSEEPPEVVIEFEINVSSGYSCVYEYTDYEGLLQDYELIIYSANEDQIGYEKFAQTSQVRYEYTSATPDKITFELWVKHDENSASRFVEKRTITATMPNAQENADA
ncbi:MAG: Stk1 family PASTA domain-containing Ser/Thr kinase [Clostridia bacterium]|nr:Stk1 family PASTA domain-containing Ser/Thr kinase [Clostridia bacterium]